MVSGLPELPENTVPSERQNDTEGKIIQILDMIGVERRPVEVYRIGKHSTSKYLLVKVVFPSKHNWLPALSNSRLLRNSKFASVYIRKSMTEEECSRDYELRKKARDKNQGLMTREWVVQNGEVKQISQISNKRMQETTRMPRIQISS